MQMAMAHETENLELNKEVLMRGLTRPFDEPHLATYYVAVDEAAQRVAGMLMTTQEWSDWRCGSIVWIQSVFVVPDYRGKSVFSKLYEFVQDIVKKSDFYGGLRLYVETENTRAQEVYKKKGMEVEHYHMMKWMKGSF
ncbi:GCN5-like N-acetyltransferase [Strigomonas culicis]|nr:GCN5-like N-acetyltransferase [Strigomonas culicis]|eukprot:EPY30328.1 GCN5-like N-acetyltransferase [Strigomonas culicis]